MATLWTDIIDPATLTGYARSSFAEYEASKGTLADFLPNVVVNDVVVRGTQGDNGLVEAATFRAFDAELDFGAREGGKRFTIELPALGQQIAISEYQQLRTRNASDEQMLTSILSTTEQVVRAVVDRMEYMRGQVLATGKATINQDNYKTDDDFGRDADMAVTAGNLWNAGSSDPLTDLLGYVEKYTEKNGEAPGTLVVSRKVWGALARHDVFKHTLTGGGSRIATTAEVQGLLDGYGIPEVKIYDRKVRVNGVATNVLPDTNLFLLPAAGQSPLGASFWGETLSSQEPGWNIAGEDRAGIVTAAYKNQEVPMIGKVVADAIGLPILANANYAFTAKVL